ncbi:MAG: PEP/pyruvate-binding domain-containing protein [Desulfobacterales bacterium]
MKAIRISLIVLFLLGLVIPFQAAADLPPPETLRQWIEEMKTSSKGPFARIRWFCNDGTIQPPKAYACKKHGGGVQHGEWTDRVKRMRAGGYYIANVLAALDPEQIISTPGYSDLYNQILIEKFLIAVDDGWIFRKALYYRGALQAEDETAVARELLLGLADEDIWSSRGFLPLRIGASLLEHGVETRSVARVRQNSLALSEKDKKFLPLRVKIHNQPDQEDAERVRQYAAGVKDSKLATEYERLAAEIDKVFASESVSNRLEEFKKKISSNPELSRDIAAAVNSLEATNDPGARFAIMCKIMAKIREQLLDIQEAELRLAAIDTSLALEIEQYTLGRELIGKLQAASRLERLQWLKDSSYAIYGAGLISAIQLQDLQGALAVVESNTMSLDNYKSTLDYLARVPGWGTQWVRFHFHDSKRKLAEIEPLAERVIQDALRSSPLFFYSNVLDSLLRDANQLVGLRHELFGQDVGAGLRNLNPGLARGTLRLNPADHHDDFDPQGIYLLPETIAELPPVAGILTAGEGNPLSHVQLLARNLGIPNVTVDESLIPKLTTYEGQKVILAASPAGAVQLMLDKGQLDHLFEQTKATDTLIHPDLKKLDLKKRELMPLSKLRASDSGRTVGPKAANLGELYHHFPDAVANGLAIPFGAFRSLLDQPTKDGKQTIFEWMEANYSEIQSLPPGSSKRGEKMESLRRQLQKYILQADPGEDFRRQLNKAMEQIFGPDGTYGVFVRSDTNVEDLPGFTGAGLNKTVANVVGFKNVLAAISQVWASPFSKRAFAWRQSHMDQPQHVYASVLLLRSVPSEKSGVMVNRDIETGQTGWLSVVVNEGVGGAVDGQAAESLRINIQTGDVRRLAQATAPWRRVLKPTGGVDKELVEATESVLKPQEIKQLITLAQELPQRYPPILDDDGNPAPADIEFGFVQSKLQLFQIRPFLESAQARSNEYLNALDKDMTSQLTQTVKLADKPQ